MRTDDDVNRMIPELNEIIPDNPNKAIQYVRCDHKDSRMMARCFDVMPHYAKNIDNMLHQDGWSDGRCDRQPAEITGQDVWTSTLPTRRQDSSEDAMRSISRCLPSKTFLDSFRVPDQEYGGIIRHGAKDAVRILRGYSA